MKWFKNTNGEESASLTFAIVSFLITSLSYLLSIFPKIGNFETRPFDPGACAAYLTPILTLYFSRRFTEVKYSNNTNINVTSSTNKVESQSGIYASIDTPSDNTHT
jgi:hypothetical protein